MTQVRILWRRADIIRKAISLAWLSLLLTALIGSLVFFIWDVKQALAALRTELEDTLEQKKPG